MKPIKYFIPFLVVLFLAGCVNINLSTNVPNPPQPTLPPPVTLEPTSPPVAQGLTEEVLRNSTFLSPQMGVPVTLVDGKFSGEVNGSPLNVVMQPGVQFGNLNSDQVPDAALLLAEDMGGSGTFVSLVVVYSNGSNFKQAPGVLIEDRPIINSIGIMDGVVKIDAILHGPNDPMANPTQGVEEEFSLVDKKIFLTRLTSAIQGGGEHMIQIDSPVDGTPVSGSVQLSGAMPIGPFENNLVLTISDAASGLLLQEGFMVNAADMGAPATFSNVITLPVVPSGTHLVVTLSELSMANGMPLAIDSVVLVVK